MKTLKILMHYADSSHTPERKKLNAFGAIGYYRIVKPAEQIKDHEVTVIGGTLDTFGDSMQTMWAGIFSQYDVFWTNYFADEQIASPMFFYRDRYKKKVIIDIDDNYLDIPETNKLYDRFKAGKRDRAILGSILSLADAVTVSTYPLKERLAQHIKLIHGIDKPIYVIPNMNDMKDWKARAKKPEEDKVTIGYWGSNSHQDDLVMALPAVGRVMKKHKNVHLRLIGTVEKDLIPVYFKGYTDEMLSRIWLGASESVFKKAPKWLAQQGWDIGIAPLVDTAFTRCKSHIKWFEYSMFKIPVLASRVYPYFMPIKGKKVIEDGVTGLLARSNEWEEKLEKLVVDKKLRLKLGKNAHDFIKKEWQYEVGDINETVNTMLKEI